MNIKLLRLLSLMLVTALLFFYTGCSKDDGNPVGNNEEVNESEVLAKYLEANGDFLGTQCPSLIAASDLYTAMQAGKDYYLIDMRDAATYGNGHIEGAVNVPAADLLKHYKEKNLQGKEKVVLICFSGQTAGWGTALLRVLGYNNVVDLKFGMCSWNAETANGWKGAVSNGKAGDFTTDPVSKPAAGSLPKIATGKTNGKEILEARVEALLAEGFGKTNLSNTALWQNLDGHFLVNYWPVAHYNQMHIKGSVQYEPKTDLKLGAALKTLPTDKPVVVYCYTGQTSAHAATYLRLLGYDARSLSYGVNALAYDNMPGTKWTDTEIKGYPLVK